MSHPDPDTAADIALRVVLGELAQILLASQRVSPERTLASAYEPIYDVTMPGAPQSTSFADAIERYGDELGFQAVTAGTTRSSNASRCGFRILVRQLGFEKVFKMPRINNIVRLRKGRCLEIFRC